MTRVANLSPSESAAVHEFISRARAEFGSALKEARLFGSRARGEGHPDSDVDIALIVADGERPRRRILHDLAFDIGLAHRVELAPLVLEEGQYRELMSRERRVALDIAHEGIPL